MATQTSNNSRAAGIYSAEEIAKELGTSLGNLHKICHRNQISLPRPEAYQKADPDIATCISVLRRNGYKVIPTTNGSRG